MTSADGPRTSTNRFTACGRISTARPASISNRAGPTYIPRRTLRTYLYVRYMKFVFLFYLALCCPLPFMPDFIACPWAVVMGGLGLICMAPNLLPAHPHPLLDHPCCSFAAHSPGCYPTTAARENEFYKFQLERVEGVYLTSRECGIGMIQSSTGSIKFMAQ